MHRMIPFYKFNKINYEIIEEIDDCLIFHVQTTVHNPIVSTKINVFIKCIEHDRMLCALLLFFLFSPLPIVYSHKHSLTSRIHK